MPGITTSTYLSPLYCTYTLPVPTTIQGVLPRRDGVVPGSTSGYRSVQQVWIVYGRLASCSLSTPTLPSLPIPTYCTPRAPRLPTPIGWYLPGGRRGIPRNRGCTRECIGSRGIQRCVQSITTYYLLLCIHTPTSTLLYTYILLGQYPPGIVRQVSPSRVQLVGVGVDTG